MLIKGQPVRSLQFFLRCLVVTALMGLTACGGRQEIKFAGRTMGTTYHITVVADGPVDAAALQGRIDAALEAVNQSMSTYRPDSDISRFNALAAADVPVSVSSHLIRVLRVAGRIYTATGGAWDGTIKPVINLWGFGKTNHPHTVPPDTEIAAALSGTGFDHIRIHGSSAISKTLPGVTLDLASIAKGYGVDVVADVLRREGCREFLVEIGGEVLTAGRRPDGRPWRVGINLPAPDAPASKVFRAVPLTDLAMATSGDYRNFFVQQGHRYSHIIDPRTGRPVDNGVVSVSIIADNCTLADGLATGVMVMGRAAGLALLEHLPGVEGVIIEKGPGGALHASATSGFPAPPASD